VSTSSTSFLLLLQPTTRGSVVALHLPLLSLAGPNIQKKYFILKNNQT
jgi:hypothetical protein